MRRGSGEQGFRFGPRLYLFSAERKRGGDKLSFGREGVLGIAPEIILKAGWRSQSILCN
jgi:hypothetical protein